MDDLLTTKQLQDLLQVDRITIYRMLSDGRLQGFKVGGQWRFSRREIETWLQDQQGKMDAADLAPPLAGVMSPSPQALPLSCIQTIQDVCAEALDVAVVTVNLDGSLLTEISNSCKFCQIILSSEEGLRRCGNAWKQADNEQVHTCHAGLGCISAPIRVAGQQVARTASCQFTLQIQDNATEEWQRTLPQLAAELGLSEPELLSAAVTVRQVPGTDFERFPQLLRRVASTFSEIGQERLDLLSRLQHISEVSRV